MSRNLLLGGRWYLPMADLGTAGGRGCSWHLVRAEEGGEPLLLQLWSPRPKDRELDKLREIYLQRFLDPEPCDPALGRFGFGEDRAWFLQEIQGQSLAEYWPEASQAEREACLKHLRHLLKQSHHPRLLLPEAIRLQAGRMVLPRVLGEAPYGLEDLKGALEVSGPPSPHDAGRSWEQAPGLTDDQPRPIRGRSQELTFLKSLVLGLSAPTPMERILVLMGEAGLGQDPLADWTAAVAETEGLWVAAHEVEHQESAGTFLVRVLQDFLRGFEADFYARYPEISRVLARRLPSFAFLRGGRRAANEEARVEADEIEAALQVLAFAAELHPRMVLVREVDRADEDFQRLLSTLALRSELPWFFTLTAVGQASNLRSFLGPMKGNPAASIMTLNRLEDGALVQVIADLLGVHVLPDSFQQGLLHASLGNPGLLRGILEKAQLDGTLVWEPKGWALAPGRSGTIQVHEDLVVQILAGRLHRLGPAGLAIARALALVDRPLDQKILGMTLGIAGDPLDEALRAATAARLVHLKDGRASLADPRLGPLALAGSAQAETRRLAKSLLRALQEEAGRPVLAVHLQFLASDEKAALQHVMEAIEQDPPSPQEAERVVNQTLEFHPSPAQRARLWEFLADAWTLGTLGGRVSGEVLGGRSPYEFGLEALGLAEVALEECADPEEGRLEQLARVLRKRALLQIRLRDLPKALKAIQTAAEVLADQPRHPEQAQLRLALGQVHMLEGFHGKGVKALEEGLQILGPEGQLGDQSNRVALLVELGRAQGQKCQFQRALGTLQSAQRILEHGQDLGKLSVVLGALAHLRLVLGQPDAAYAHLREALHAARLLDDLELQGECHLLIGTFRSLEQSLAPALHHLDSALQRFVAIGDRVGIARVRVWKARTLAALGEAVDAEMELLKALSLPPERLTAMERGDFAFLQAEIAAFRSALGDANRLFQMAAETFEGAGLLWRERLARLRQIQVEALAALEQAEGGRLEGPWTRLEQMKAPVEGSGSRWLEMEWHRAHALLLMTARDPSEGIATEALSAWSEVQAAARELRFSAVALEASSQSAALLIKRGERLGARSRLQDAYGTFQELWSRIPEAHSLAFLGRPDIHRFRQAVEGAGLRFVLPERVDPLADWTPTQVSLPVVSPVRGNP
jgi:tetratricopeptide (TPR) repeat protein